MKHTAAIKEFSRFAHTYNAHNVIQDEVAQTLVELLPQDHYAKVIDIGCGSGAVYKYIQKAHIKVRNFIALDSSSAMLDIHPEDGSMLKVCADFNTPEAFSFESDKESIMLSSSALQWSRDLDFTFSMLASKTASAYFAIFTANTFQTLHKTAGIESPIYTTEELQKSIEKYYEAGFEVKRYKLHFASMKEMFRYIKKSGVSGGEKQLSYKETKRLMDTYPLDYLEFEVLFVKAKPLQVLS